ncbi:PD-(D/E)XK nuclease family protein [Aliarcobacter cryaerophilus]|uniref:PD-(D/E)XK nuclease family protein n=1 Tax=Aliarcobacter cryaerophilus TaxID=28198 RepID=UPI0021B2C4E4|nr:PD-(D/E)XK nuclease family protein [Aliarcobacter cryaerophilus]MCT7464710.1 PD-(D/E)XK nuclease family protein [Aliarcobacter cryaerophilus]
MNLKQNLIITYSNQKARELKKYLKNPLDKVVTLQSYVNEYFEKKSFKTFIKPIIATSFIYKTIKEEKIDYLDFISQNSDLLDLIYDFILKVNASKIELPKILKGEKLKAIEILNKKYQEFKLENNLMDMNDAINLVIDDFSVTNFSQYEKIYLDDFEIKNIKLYKSSLELELLNKFLKIAIPLEQIQIKNNNAKLYRLEKHPFDINDEVESALKLARKLLEDNEELKSSDICIITSDINEYAPIFRLYLPKYELKGFDSKGISLKLFNEKKSFNTQVNSAYENINQELKQYESISQKFGLNIDIQKVRDKLIDEIYILEDKVGIELTEANQLIGLNKEFEHVIFIGADINHFPPKRSDNFLFTSEIAQEYFCENNYFENSLLQYEELKKISKNLYILYPKYKEKRELSPSIIIDKNIENIIDISNVKAKKEKIQQEDFLESISSQEFTKYDGLEVVGVKADHLSASQLGAYSKCPLKYLYINKLRVKKPSEEEDGFDVAQMGTLMHSCFEIFSKRVQGNRNLNIQNFKSIMLDVLEEAYEEFINDPNNEIKEENIYHMLFKHELSKGLKEEDKENGLLIKFINYYDENKEFLNYFINSEFEKEFALNSNLEPYKIENESDQNYFIRGYIDRFDNLDNQVNIIDYKSKKADGILQDKLEEIKSFKDFQLGLYTLFATQEHIKDVDSHLLTFKSKNDYTIFARVTTKEDLIPKVKDKDIGVLFDEDFKNSFKANIFAIKEKIEQGNFRFDSSDDTYCGYCEIWFMCNKSLLDKGKIYG